MTLFWPLSFFDVLVTQMPIAFLLPSELQKEHQEHLIALFVFSLKVNQHFPTRSCPACHRQLRPEHPQAQPHVLKSSSEQEHTH